MPTKQGVRQRRASEPRRRAAAPTRRDGADQPRPWLFGLLGAMAALSAWAPARVEVLGFLAHPFLLPLGLLALGAGIAGIERVPRGVRWSVAAFVACYLLVDLPGGIDPAGLVKVVTMLGTIVVVAGAARTEQEVTTGMAALVLTMGVVAVTTVLGFSGNELEGINPLEGVASRTGFSIYMLPALLLGGHLALERHTSNALRVALLVACSAIVVSIFSSGNRSGYLGVVLIALLLLSRGRRPRDVVLLALAGAVSYYALTRWGSTAVLQLRIDRTFDGPKDVRADIFLEAMRIGAEHPFRGVTPQSLDQVLGPRVGLRAASPHNLLAFVFGGGGVVLLSALVALLVAMWRAPRQVSPAPTPGQRLAAILVHNLVVLFVVRSMFSQETLTTPGFPVALALALALVLVRASDDTTEPTPARSAWATRRRGGRPVPAPLPDLFEQARQRRHAAAP